MAGEMAALAIGLGGAVGELWVQDGLLLLLGDGSVWRFWLAAIISATTGKKTPARVDFSR